MPLPQKACPDTDGVFGNHRNPESSAAIASGQVRKARELTQHAVELAQSHGLKEEAAGYTAGEARFEATLGNDSEAGQKASKALTISKGVGVETGAASALARAGKSAQAKTIADGLKKQFPLSTFRNTVDIPIILALVETHRGNTPMLWNYSKPVFHMN